MDESAESLAAIHAGWSLAEKMGTRCHLVHGHRDYLDLPLPSTEAQGLRAARREALEGFRARFALRRGRDLPIGALTELHVRPGNPVVVLKEAVRRWAAGLLVLGGRHHGRLSTWLGGSTACNAVRCTDTPVLVIGPTHPPFRRLLAAVDLSDAAPRVVRAARELADVGDGHLRLLHVVPPIPDLDPDSAFDRAQVRSAAFDHLEALIEPDEALATPDLSVTEGPTLDVIVRTCREEGMDLLVVGTHGSDRKNPMLLGSITERLLNALPVSLLVVPTSGAS